MINKYFTVIVMGSLLLIFMSNNTFAELDISSLDLTKEEEAYLEEHDTFYYAIAVDYAPVEYINYAGEPRGFGKEYLNKASELLGINFIPISGFEDYTWEDCMHAIKNGHIDLLPTISKTKERSEYITFTDPYFTANIIVIGYDDAKLVLEPKDMKGAKIVLPAEYWQNEYIRNQLGNHVEIINTTNMSEALEIINKKKAEYTFLESTVYNYYSQLESFRNLKIVGEIPIVAEHCMGTAKENQILIDILNKVFLSVNKDEIYRNAMIIEPQHKLNSHIIIFFSVFVLILIIIILYLLKGQISALFYKKQAQRNKQKLIENLSHDLKTPLSTLKVNLKLLKMDIVEEHEKEKYYSILDRNIDCIDGIIEDLYDITHLQESLIKKNVVSIYVDDFLQELYDLYVDIFKAQNRNLTYIRDKEFPLAKIKINKKTMERVISNLLSNALKYTHEHGEVEMSYKVIDNNITITVTDNGIGIEKKALNFIFERFYQSDNSMTSGKGLGLAIAKEIVEWHQGTITVSSKKNQFTAFKITLPI